MRIDNFGRHLPLRLVHDCVILKTNVTVNRNVVCCELGCTDLTKISHSATVKETEVGGKRTKNFYFYFYLILF